MNLLIRVVLLPIWLPFKLIGEAIEHRPRRRHYRSTAKRATPEADVDQALGCASICLGFVLPGSASLLLGRRIGALILIGFIASAVLVFRSPVFWVPAVGFWLWGVYDWSVGEGERGSIPPE